MQKILELAYLTAWQFGNEVTPPRFVRQSMGGSGAGK
jgi:hypothetical protein